MQTYTDLQVILVNDGSTDNSSAIAQSFVDADKRFTLIQQSNQGQSVARNVGIKEVTGEYLVFVDADDYLDVDFVEKHIAALGNVNYVQSGYRRVTVGGEVIEQKLPIHRYQFTSACMRLYRTAWMKQHGLTFPDSMIYEDVIFSLLLWGTHPKVKILNYYGYNYTYNTSSTTATIHREAQAKLIQMIKGLPVNWWPKYYTIIRLFFHLQRTKHHEK